MSQNPNNEERYGIVLINLDNIKQATDWAKSAIPRFDDVENVETYVESENAEPTKLVIVVTFVGMVPPDKDSRPGRIRKLEEAGVFKSADNFQWGSLDSNQKIEKIMIKSLSRGRGLSR